MPPDDVSCEEQSFAGWAAVTLEMRTSDDILELVLLRDPEWLAEHSVRVGSDVDLRLEELNVEGPARVIAVQHDAPVDDGHGCPVTGTVRHLASSLVAVRLDAAPAAIEATPQHPYYSLDRGGWVRAESLAVGERIATEAGETRVSFVAEYSSWQ